MSETTIESPGSAGAHSGAEATRRTIDLPVLGMTCAACVRRVERAVSELPGVAKAEVNLPLSRARLVIDPAIASVSGAAAAIRAAGYEVPADVVEMTGEGAGAARLAAIGRAEVAEQRTLRRDATIAIVLTVPLLAIAMAHGLVEGTASVVAQLVLGTIVVLVPGRHYFRRGLAAVRHASPDMNTLIALGAGTAWLWSTIVALRWLAGTRHHMPAVYFEAGAAIVAFVMIGKLLEARVRGRLSEAVRGLLSLVPPNELAPGDSVTVKPGERIPADGTVVEGHSAIDEAMLTGESMPVDKAEGSPVYAGTLNHHGALVVRVARAGTDTALARIARAVEDAQGSKAPIARLADRVAAVFVPAVLGVAALTFGAWLVTGASADVALERMIAVLVIACPCALGLATPAAIAVGTGRGAELGVLFKGGEALEIASSITVACFDKTGTLTEGKPALLRAPSDDVLRIAASLEQHSEHPIARAIVAGARARGLALATPSDVTAEPGAGVTGSVDGARIRVGRRDYLALAGITVPADEAASSVAHVSIGDRYAGAIEVADPARADARQVIASLRDIGVTPIIVTGDRGTAARPIADAVGIDELHAEMTPMSKAAFVRGLRDDGRRVAMVGDGINDAPALAAADLGVALGTGTDIAAAAADVTLLRGGIGALPTAIELARATLHTIRRNLVAAFAYNLVCIPLAAGALYPITGWQLSPVIASAAMSLSSISVLLSSLRLRRFVPRA